MFERIPAIDLDQASFALDIDLSDDEARVVSRMADGGDPDAAERERERRRERGETRETLFSDDED